MEKQKILVGLEEAIIDLDGDRVISLINDGLAANLTPMEMIMEGMNPGLTIIGEDYDRNTRFMADLVIAGEIMTEAVESLRPKMEFGGGMLMDTLVIGTVEGDIHDIGKKITAAIFMGSGYKVYDIGVDVSANKFVEAAKEYNALIVGASAVLSPVKAYLKVVNKALIDANLRDDVIYAIGGWGISQEWSDKCGADLYGENAIDGLRKVNMIKAGKLPKLKDRR